MLAVFFSASSICCSRGCSNTRAMESSHEKQDCEEAPFLGKSTLPSRSHGKKTCLMIVVHVVFFIINLLLLPVAIHVARSSLPDDARTSPALENKALDDLKIQYQNSQYSTIRMSQYIGKPNKSVDEAWHNLFAPMSLRVSTSELAKHSLDSVGLPNGGHLAWLGVFHELHCIKMLYQMNYRDHYHPDLSEEALRDLQVHNDHCIDQLRNAIMCHGDVGSLTTFVWSERWEKPLLSPARPRHQCFDWKLLVDSVKDRIVDDDELMQMENPLL